MGKAGNRPNSSIRKRAPTPIEYRQKLERILVLEEQMRDESLPGNIRDKTADALADAIEEIRPHEANILTKLGPEKRTRLFELARQKANEQINQGAN